jgi:UDP-N-acetylmuramoyl-tripeptide--D-alanyl-D-alanine ligase
MDTAEREQALLHRSRLTSVKFVGITGSCGKTTTKDLAAGLLSPPLRGSSNPGSGNCGGDLIRHLLQVEPSHDFCIQELGAWGPGTLDAGLELVRPEVGVVLNVRRDHYSLFHGLEHTQREKAKVVTCLPRSGTAILNADDPRVAAMRGDVRARVLTFGRHADADFRMENVSSVWPERLSFDLLFGGERRRVQTQLAGEHVAGSALAAIAIAHTFGISIADAAGRLERIPPTSRRMSFLALDSGVAVVRDDFKATSDSLDEVLHFVDQAQATRKIVVIGRISDHPGRSRSVYTSFVHAAQRVADLVVLVGERAEELWGRDRRRSPDFLAEFSGGRAKVELFETVQDASRFFKDELRSGDLVLLKGSGASDHLERIVLEHRTGVQCWRARCGRVVACDECELLDVPARPNDPLEQCGCR